MSKSSVKNVLVSTQILVVSKKIIAVRAAIENEVSNMESFFVIILAMFILCGVIAILPYLFQIACLVIFCYMGYFFIQLLWLGFLYMTAVLITEISDVVRWFKRKFKNREPEL